MNNLKSLTEDEFDAQYTPIADDLGDTVRSGMPSDLHSKNLWSVLDINGNLYLHTGWYVVNRIGYIITEEAWVDETEAVWFIASKDETDIGDLEESKALTLINDELTRVLADHFGWNAVGDEDDDTLNELTHEVGGLIRKVVNVPTEVEEPDLEPTSERDGPWKITWQIDDTNDSKTPVEAAQTVWRDQFDRRSASPYDPCVFTVTDTSSGETVEVDLHKFDPSYDKENS